MKDLFGRAILDFQTKNKPEDLVTETSISEKDELSVAYLFRSYDSMPKIEQAALESSKGKVLDVGCGAGSHSLYLSSKGIDTHPVDISPSAVKACKMRGLGNAIVSDLLDVTGKFDTILMLMNGTGIFRTIEKVPAYLKKLKSLLTLNGQILIDSSDIIYMFDEDIDGGKWIQSSDYYGEVTFNIHYKGQSEVSFEWLYLDYQTLRQLAVDNGFKCELVCEGEHFDYLARLY